MFNNHHYNAPGGSYSRLYADMAEQTHLLIAGATGSGKSTVINGIINALLHDTPDDDRFYFIDLKRVELGDYRFLPHTLGYADDIGSAKRVLQSALDTIEARYRDMQRRRIKRYDGAHIYVIIDEFADLMTTAKKEVLPLIQRIGQIGRAAAVHIIAATQCPLATIIPTTVKVNFTAILGLRTATKAHSRNIIDRAGCEDLPDPRTTNTAYGYYQRGANTDLYQLPMVPEAERMRLVDYWTNYSRPAWRVC